MIARKFYVYKLCDPRDGIARYIGFTKDLKARRWEHIGRRDNWRLVQWISELRSVGVRPAIVAIAEYESPARAARCEKVLIWRAFRKGLPLLNARPACAPGRKAFPLFLTHAQIAALGMLTDPHKFARDAIGAALKAVRP